jgi:hypothetical protein
MKTEQTEFELKVVHRCKRCKRIIDHYGYGTDCERKILNEFKHKINQENYEVIYNFLKRRFTK